MKKAQNGVQAALDAQKKRRADAQAASDKRRAEAMDKRKASLTISPDNSASTKAKEEARAKEAAKVKAALDAQKQRKESIQADYDKRKAEGMAKRRAAGLPAGKSPTVQEAKIQSKPSKANKDYRLYSEREIDNYTPTSREPEKKKGGGGSRAVATTSKANTPAPNRQQKITPKKGLSPIPLPERKKPTVAREYSKTERNINEQIEKIKKGEGSTEAAQMKIKALRQKERAQQAKSQRQEKRSDMKMLRKAARAGKFNARQVKKSAK